jgi:hypothetical protein
MDVGYPNRSISIGRLGKDVHIPPVPSVLITYENGNRVQGP